MAASINQEPRYHEQPSRPVNQQAHPQQQVQQPVQPQVQREAKAQAIQQQQMSAIVERPYEDDVFNTDQSSIKKKEAIETFESEVKLKDKPNPDQALLLQEMQNVQGNMEIDPGYHQKLGVSLVPLDFAKLKAFFKTQIANEIQICATLQALRWRLTRVGAAMRKQIMLSYIHYDLLESGEILSEQNTTVFETLFFCDSLKVREYLIALINSMASEYLGRTYLI